MGPKGQMKARSASPAGDRRIRGGDDAEPEPDDRPEMDDSRDVLKMGRSGPIIAEMKGSLQARLRGCCYAEMHSHLLYV